jgi:tripartite-type tricarboxylate transporter receptor subunit TctC
MQRRHLLTAALGVAGSALVAPSSRAQGMAYPVRPIKLVVGFPPGGGVLAASDLARAAPDGYTLLVANTGPFAIAPYLQSKAPYDPVRQFTYIGQIAEAGYVVATRSDHPARDLKGFVDWARANAGKANYASGGIGSSTHLNGELLNGVAGLDLLHVPYKGSAPAVQDLIGGQTHVLIDAGTVLLPQVKGGRLKALAVTGSRRDPNLPDVPTVREQGFAGLEAAGFQGLVGPAGMPREIVDRLSSELVRVLAQPDVRSRFAAAGSEVTPRPAAEFAAYVKAESEKWSGVIRTRKLQLD